MSIPSLYQTKTKAKIINYSVLNNHKQLTIPARTVFLIAEFSSSNTFRVRINSVKSHLLSHFFHLPEARFLLLGVDR